MQRLIRRKLKKVRWHGKNALYIFIWKPCINKILKNSLLICQNLPLLHFKLKIKYNTFIYPKTPINFHNDLTEFFFAWFQGQHRCARALITYERSNRSRCRLCGAIQHRAQARHTDDRAERAWKGGAQWGPLCFSSSRITLSLSLADARTAVYIDVYARWNSARLKRRGWWAVGSGGCWKSLSGNRLVLVNVRKSRSKLR